MQIQSWYLRHKIELLITLLFLCIGLNFGVLHLPFTIFKAPNELAYSHAYVANSNDLSPNDKIFGTSSLASLPDDWFQNKYEYPQKWYRIKLKTNKYNEEFWAVYLPSVTHNASVFVNNRWIGQSGSFDDPVSRHHNNPLLFAFPAALLTKENNVIDIRVKASHHSQGLLGKVYVGPQDLLQSAYAFKYTIRVELIRWLTMSMFIVGAIVFCFYLARPQDKTYGLFALLLIMWGLHNLNLFVFDIPTSAHFWEAMTMSTLGWMVVLMIFFNHRYIGVSARLVERMALIFVTLGLFIFALPDVGWILSIGYKVWDSFLIIFGCYAVYILVKVFWQTPNQDVYLMLLVGALILALGFHDILVVNHFWPRTDGLIIQYSAIPALILFSWFLIRRFVQSIESAERLAATLEKRVEQKSDELKQQFDRLQAIKQQQTLAQERERIMRDMHDGIGGQLVSIAASLQDKKGDVFEQLLVKVQSSINDLRMVIDSMDPMLSNLSSLLGNMRPRLEQQVTLANIALRWEVIQHAEIKLDPQSNLHISRIIHEAVANAIKHAKCKQVSISSLLSENLVTIDIKDDGIGINSSEPSNMTTRGIKNMHFRAEQIGGELSLHSDGNVTCVRLRLVIEA